MSWSGLVSFLKSKESLIFNAVVVLVTIGGQQLFSFFAFSCPCQVAKNLYYGLAFIGVPALILLIVGYVFNDHTWRLLTGTAHTSVPLEHSQRSRLMKSKLLCFVFCDITGRPAESQTGAERSRGKGLKEPHAAPEPRVADPCLRA